MAHAANLCPAGRVIGSTTDPPERGTAMSKRSIAAVAVAAGLLAAAAPAQAGTFVGNPSVRSTELVFSGDAYDNEMGLHAAAPRLP
jgi:hypothetical protein